MVLMKPCLKMERLELGYKNHHRIDKVVGPVDLEIQEGESMGIIGESGAGKSTLGLEILGLLSWKGGSRLGGTLNAPWSFDEIAYIPQDPLSSLDPLCSIGEQLREVEPSSQAIETCLRRVHLNLDAIRLKSYPHEWSGGMLQRLLIAMALLKKPKLLIADEPTSSLDVTLQAEIMKLFGEIREMGMTFLFITHNLPLAANFCDCLAVMRKGMIVEKGPVESLLKDPLAMATRCLSPPLN